MSKWTTLIHNGILFNPPYEPINVPIKYDGTLMKLDSKKMDNPFHITAEEGAYYFAQNLERDKRLNKKEGKKTVSATFKKNFWEDWKKVLGKGHPIKDFDKVDFTPMIKHIEKQTEEKKKETKEEKAEKKKQKEEREKPYKFATVDGVQYPVTGYTPQPPSLFIGHGTHPLTGRIKKRIQPEDVIINVSKKNIPKCTIQGKSCKWKDVVEDKDVTWLASYETFEKAYMTLKRDESHFVTSSDMAKFDKAKKLGSNIGKIREKYNKDLLKKDKTTRQLATAVYLLDILAIRPGTEKDESKEANTLGLTTLKCENIKLLDDQKIKINFTGKSSIEFEKTFKVEKIVYDNLKSLIKDGKEKSDLFPNVNATTLNDYLKTLMDGLTAKNFRTWKASSVLQEELDKNIPKTSLSPAEKKLFYDKANIAVALALNHKKMGGSDKQIQNIKEKMKDLRKKMKDTDSKSKKETIKKSIEANKLKLIQAEENVATGTSKTNYIDPRIVVAWCKKAEMPIEKGIYNKGALKKFTWAMGTKSEWSF